MANIHKIKEILTAVTWSVLLQLAKEYQKENTDESFKNYLTYDCKNFNLDLPFVHFSLLESIINKLMNISKLEAFKAKMPLTNLSQVFYQQMKIDNQITFSEMLFTRLDNLHIKNLFYTIISTIDDKDPELHAELYEYIIYLLMTKLIDMKLSILNKTPESAKGQDIWQLNAKLSEILLFHYNNGNLSELELEEKAHSTNSGKSKFIKLRNKVNTFFSKPKTPAPAIEDSKQVRILPDRQNHNTLRFLSTHINFDDFTKISFNDRKDISFDDLNDLMYGRRRAQGHQDKLITSIALINPEEGTQELEGDIDRNIFRPR